MALHLFIVYSFIREHYFTEKLGKKPWIVYHIPSCFSKPRHGLCFFVKITQTYLLFKSTSYAENENLEHIFPSKELWLFVYYYVIQKDKKMETWNQVDH